MRRLFLFFGFIVAAAAVAQTAHGDIAHPEDTTVLVRWNIHESDFFAYKISTTTNLKRFFPRTDLPSEYTREVTYSISERILSIGKDGIVEIEANIDSMTLHAHKAGEDVKFNSQEFLTGSQMVDLSGPELQGTSMILNKPFTYRMTLEGDFIDLKGFESWIDQIDTTAGVDSNLRIGMKQYMSANFLRTLVMPQEGFVYNRRYKFKENWKASVQRQVFTIPTIDSANYNIQIPSTKKRFFIFSDGTLFSRGQEIRDYGFKETSIIDSASGTLVDTVLLEQHGHIHDVSRIANLRAYLHTSQISYYEDIHEETIVRWEGYEAR